MVEVRAPRASKPLRIGNCSGFYGDRLSAMREMLEGGSLDYLTGDYLAELTMLILGKDTMKDSSLGYAKTFVRQLEDCLGLALENGVKIARKHTGRRAVAVLDHAYHGRTNLTMAMNYKASPYATGFGPFAGDVYHAPSSYPYRDVVR